jgi:hypothetical protein
LGLRPCSRLNRLTRWSICDLGRVRDQVDARVVPCQMKISRAATTIACRLRLAREPAGRRARRAGLACFLPDGRLPVVPARDGQLPVSGPGQALAAYADLSGQSGHPRGDMVVDGRVMPYIGNTGFGFPAGQFAPGILAHVGPDGAVRQAPGGLAFPHGMAGTPDGTTLILAKTYPPVRPPSTPPPTAAWPGSASGPICLPASPTASPGRRRRRDHHGTPAGVKGLRGRGSPGRQEPAPTAFSWSPWSSSYPLRTAGRAH